MTQRVKHVRSPGGRRGVRGAGTCAWIGAVLWTVLLLVILVAFAPTLAGCGGEPLPSPTSSPPRAEPTTSTSGVSAAPTVVAPAPPSSLPSAVPAPSSTISSTTRPASRMPVSLVRVVDGDTIVMRFAGGAEERVRLIGIDAPETSYPDQAVERMGRAATARISELLARGPLELERDVEERDQYGRLLAYVWAGQVFVNLELVREGFASVFTVPPNVRYAEEFLGAQHEAREEERGLWSPHFSGSNPAVVSWDTAARHIGKRVTVEGPVVGTKWASGSKGSPTFLDLGRPYPDPARFTVLIWGEYRNEFPRPPESMYLGRVIRVTGDVSTYKGVTQMKVMGPDQIEVVE